VTPQHLLILGATSDIARALARRFADAGCPLTLAGRDSRRLDADAADLHLRYGIPVHVAECDALRPETHAAFMAGLDPAPDIVACVFGYLGDAARARSDGTEAATILATNFTGAVSLLDRAAELLEARGRGGIIGISSVAGDRGRQSNYHYGSAKAGFTAYLAGLRNRLHRSGVHVLTVKPGYVHTRMTEGMTLPGALTAQPDEVADAVFRAWKRRRNVIYVRPVWRLVMLVLRHIPESLFKRLSL